MNEWLSVNKTEHSVENYSPSEWQNRLKRKWYKITGLATEAWYIFYYNWLP